MSAASGISLDDAPDWLAAGGLLAFATETVWGLGADARSESAVERLRSFKGRADDAPISVLVDDASALASLGFAPGAAARKLASRFWPGPLTLVMPCAPGFARGIAREDGAVGVRCSPHPAARALARRLARRGVGPVTATSLNRSGEPPARNRAEALAVCGRGTPRPRVLELADDAGGAAPSTVVDVCQDPPRVLRQGAIDAEALESALMAPMAGAA